jgi:hypothetical protein
MIAQTEKFRVGMVAISQGIHHQANGNRPFEKFIIDSIRRHTQGDWGDCCKDDKETNNDALKSGNRLFSVYLIPKELGSRKEKIWIITEADRSSTTILFPSEY